MKKNPKKKTLFIFLSFGIHYHRNAILAARRIRRMDGVAGRSIIRRWAGDAEARRSCCCL